MSESHFDDHSDSVPVDLELTLGPETVDVRALTVAGRAWFGRRSTVAYPNVETWLTRANAAGLRCHTVPRP